MEFKKVNEVTFSVIVNNQVLGTVWKGENKCWQGYDNKGNQVTHYETSRKKAAEMLIKELSKNANKISVDEKTAKKRSETLEKAFWKANKIGENVLAVRVLEGYKVFKECSDQEIEALANYIEQRLGFGRDLLSQEQRDLLEKGGFI